MVESEALVKQVAIIVVAVVFVPEDVFDDEWKGEAYDWCWLYYSQYYLDLEQ
jgi:hypothetical protein